MKNFVLFLVIFLSTISCSRNSEEVKAATNIDVATDIYVKDSAGNNILGTSNYNNQTIKIFYLLNGVKTEVYSPTADYPRNFVIITDSNGQKFCRVSLNGADNSDPTTTYIQWNENQTDELKAEIKRGENYTIVEKVYFNNNLVCPDREHRVFTIIK